MMVAKWVEMRAGKTDKVMVVIVADKKVQETVGNWVGNWDEMDDWKVAGSVEKRADKKAGKSILR